MPLKSGRVLEVAGVTHPAMSAFLANPEPQDSNTWPCADRLFSSDVMTFVVVADWLIRRLPFRRNDSSALRVTRKAVLNQQLTDVADRRR